jgi:hypothetical protein
MLRRSPSLAGLSPGLVTELLAGPLAGLLALLLTLGMAFLLHGKGELSCCQNVYLCIREVKGPLARPLAKWMHMAVLLAQDTRNVVARVIKKVRRRPVSLVRERRPYLVCAISLRDPHWLIKRFLGKQFMEERRACLRLRLGDRPSRELDAAETPHRVLNS